MRSATIAAIIAALSVSCLPVTAPPAGAQTVDVNQAPSSSATPQTAGVTQNKVKVGDLVRPASGGPLMTVTAIKDAEAICESPDGTRKNARYPIAQLVVISGLLDQALSPSNEPRTYRPCPANVVTSSGRHECLGLGGD